MGGTDLIIRFIGMDLVSRVAERAGGNIDKMERRISSGAALSGQGLLSTGMAMITTGTGFLTLSGAITAAAVVAFDAFAQFQSSMVMTVTHAGLLETEVDRVKQGILSMATEVGASPKALSDAFYFVQSALTSLPPPLQDVNGRLSILREAAKLAAIGHSDLTETTRTLTSVIVSYGGALGDPTAAAAQLNAIIGNGAVTMSQFDSAMRGGLLPIAASAGVSLSSLGAAFGTLTDMGYGASQSATYLRGAIIQMSMPSGPASKALAAIGLTGDQVTQQMGFFNQVLQDAGINQSVLANDLQKSGSISHVLNNVLMPALRNAGLSGHDAGALIEKAFGGVRSGAAIIGLTTQLDGLAQKEDKINNSTSEWAHTWDYYRKNDPQFLINQLKATMEVLEITIGGALLPVVQQLLGFITPMVARFTEWAQTHEKLIGKVIPLAIAISGLIGVGLVVSGMILMFGGALIIAAGSAGAFLAGLSGLLWLIPIGIGLFALFGDKTDGLGGKVLSLALGFAEALPAAFGRLIAAGSSVLSFLKDHKEAVQNVASVISVLLIPLYIGMAQAAIASMAKSAAAAGMWVASQAGVVLALYMEGLGFIQAGVAMGIHAVAMVLTSNTAIACADAIDVATAAIWRQTAAMLANPVVLLAVGIAVLIGLLVVLTTNVNGSRDAFARWGEHNETIKGGLKGVNDHLVANAREYHAFAVGAENDWNRFASFMSSTFGPIFNALGTAVSNGLAYAGRASGQYIADTTAQFERWYTKTLAEAEAAWENFSKQPAYWLARMVGSVVGTFITLSQNFNQGFVDILTRASNWEGEMARAGAQAIFRFADAYNTGVHDLVVWVGTQLATLSGHAMVWAIGMGAAGFKAGTDFATNLALEIMKLPSIIGPWLVRGLKSFLDWSTGVGNAGTKAGGDLQNNLAIQLDSSLNSIQPWTIQSLKAFLDWATGLGKLATKAGGDFQNYLAIQLNRVIDFLLPWAQRLDQAIADLPKNFLKIGFQIMEGLLTGLAQGAPAPLKFIAQHGANLVSTLRSILGIHSPSTVFAELGDAIPQGVALGILRSEKDATGAMTHLSQGLVKTYDISAVPTHTKTQMDLATSILKTDLGLSTADLKVFKNDASMSSKESVDAIVQNWRDGMYKATTGLATDLNSAGTNLDAFMGKFNQDGSQGIDQFATNFGTSMGKIPTEAVQPNLDKANTSLDAFTQGLPDKGSAAGKAYTDAVAAAFTLASGQWVTIGEQISQGLANGISSSSYMVSNAAANAVAAAVQSAKVAGGIQSPSRVMHDEVGLMIGAGMASGITDSKPLVGQAATDMYNLQQSILRDFERYKGLKNSGSLEDATHANMMADVIRNKMLQVGLSVSQDGKISGQVAPQLMVGTTDSGPRFPTPAPVPTFIHGYGGPPIEPIATPPPAGSPGGVFPGSFSGGGGTTVDMTQVTEKLQQLVDELKSFHSDNSTENASIQTKVWESAHEVAQAVTSGQRGLTNGIALALR